MPEVTTLARQAIGLIDLTLLNAHDNERDIVRLCQRAMTPAGPVAAVCIAPPFVSLARQVLDDLPNHDIQLATVVNFPSGQQDLAQVIAETETAIADGADEIDVVFPYHAFMKGDLALAELLIAGTRQACGKDKLLKVILETGVLVQPELIEQAAELAVEAGANFIKTSTGRATVNATPAAAKVLLTWIAEQDGNIGFKAAGGIRTASDAAQYMQLAIDVLGESWLSARHFRLGASSLLDDLLATLGFNTQQVSASDF